LQLEKNPTMFIIPTQKIRLGLYISMKHKICLYYCLFVMFKWQKVINLKSLLHEEKYISNIAHSHQ